MAWHEQKEVQASYALNEFGKIDVLVNNEGVMPQSFHFRKKSMNGYDDQCEHQRRTLWHCSCYIYNEGTEIRSHH